MSHPFKISDKVVCVDASNLFPNGGDPIFEGTVYVVRDICFKKPGVKTDGVKLVGVHGGFYQAGICRGEESGYKTFRFRKLDDIKAENALKRSHEVSV